MAKTRKLSKMGQTAYKADQNPAASKAAKSVAKKTTKMVSDAKSKGNFDYKSRPSDTSGRVVKGPTGKAANAVVEGRISQVKKEDKLRDAGKPVPYTYSGQKAKGKVK